LSTTTPVPITDEREKRAFVQRIADSPGFRSAPRLRDFLLFVTDVALSGRSSEISEQYIGREVFHRATDYDTANDNIVRVSARQLRIKLHEYADTEGNADPWVLDIPKGGYVPVFTRRQPAVVEAPPANRMSPRWRIAAVVCAAIALLATGAWVSTLTGRAGRDKHRSPLTDLVLRPGQRTLVVLADSSMVLLHELTGQMTTTDDYAARQPPPPARIPSLDALTRSIATQQLTSVADVGFAVNLLRARPDALDRIVVAHARNAGPRSFKEGNAILLGGPRSNPWANLFESRVNYRFDFSGEPPSARLVNTNPRPGEPAIFVTERHNGVVVKSFARIAALPNLDNSGRVLLLAGTTIEATEAATEFFLGERSGTMLAQALGRDPAGLSAFEVLLEVSAIGGMSHNSRIVATRLLP